METKELLTNFLSNTFTQDSAQHRLALTKEFLEYYFFTSHENQNLTYLLNKFINEKNENRDEFNALFGWGYRFFESFNRDNLYQLLATLESEVKNLPIAILYLPIVLPIYHLPRLSGWFRRNIRPNFLLDIKFDRDLIAGCAIVWQETYYDFSLRYFLNLNKPAIKKIIEDYLPKTEAAQAEIGQGKQI